MITDFDKLVDETARAFNVPPDEILGASRKHDPAMARHVVMALWSDYHPFQDAANRCNRNCHNSAMYARERVLNRAGYDADFARVVAGISARCKQAEEKPANS